MYLQNLGVDGRISLGWFLKKLIVKLYTVLNWLRIRLTGEF
jgi:hypothetical protein